MAWVKEIRKIYSDGRHNAFTDIEYWKGHYYVTFRNAGRHAVPGDYGDILVIRSEDLRSWEVCARLSAGDDHDDRDPHLLDLGDELGVYFFSGFPERPGGLLYTVPGNGRHLQSYASFTSDGTSWSAPQLLWDGWAVWQVERFGDVCYASFMSKEDFVIARSSDGRNWEEVSTIQFPIRPTAEAGIWVAEDGKMKLIVRMRGRGYEPSAYFAESEPPYKEWHLKELGYIVHSPVIRQVGDELWVAGRAFGRQLPLSMVPPEPPKEKVKALARLDERLAKPQEWHVALWRLVGDRLDPILVLPSRGDNAYPGMVVEEGRVLVSYYSQHDVDNGPKPKPGEFASEIFLAEIEP